MMEAYGFTYAEMGITTGLVQAGFLVFALTSSFLAVRLGAFTVILGSLFICTAALGGLIMAENFISISIYLILLGGCAASIWVPMVAVSQQYIAAHYQGRALGFRSSGTSYGVLTNSILITLFLTATSTTTDWRNIWVAAFAIAGGFCVCIAVFFRYLSRHHPLIPTAAKPAADATDVTDDRPKSWHAILNRDAYMIFLFMFLAGIACMPYQAYLSSFLVDEHAVTLPQSAQAWRVIGLTGMVSGFAIGWLADRITIRCALTLVCTALVISSGLVLPAQAGTAQMYGAAVLFGLAFYAIYGLIPAYISHRYRHGGVVPIIFSLGSVSLGLGGVLGNTVGGWLKETTGTFAWLYLLILVAAVGMVALTGCLQREQVTTAA